MSAVEEVQFPAKVILNRDKTKVLFAEVDSDLADILLSFLTFPLGKIVSLFRKHYGERAPVVGSLNTLYKGLENLDEACFWTKVGKQMLLNPRSCVSNRYCRILNPSLDSETNQYFDCGNQSCSYKGHVVSIYYPNYGKCSYCSSTLDSHRGSLSCLDDVFTVETTRFLISDDMRIVPLSGSIVQNLLKLGITDTDGIEEKTTQFGFNEIMELLKGLMLSRTPLTDLILHKVETNPCIEKYETISSPQIDKKEASSCLSKMVLEVVLQKSTNKLLFAYANEDFVDFLFSLFSIPLGGVAQLLHGCTGVGSVDNLYGSIASFHCTKHLKTEGIKAMLLKPTLAPMYASRCQILPLQVEDVSNWLGLIGFKPRVLDPKGKGCYVKEPRMFLVSNDLTVTPLSVLLTISKLSMLEVPLSDVEEVKVEIGVEEALKILKASLTSTAVLTNALKPVIQIKGK